MNTTPATPEADVAAVLAAHLTAQYGHHFTTTRAGIVVGEHHDFSRHPLIGDVLQWMDRILAERTSLLVDREDLAIARATVEAKLQQIAGAEAPLPKLPAMEYPNERELIRMVSEAV